MITPENIHKYEKELRELFPYGFDWEIDRMTGKGVYANYNYSPLEMVIVPTTHACRLCAHALAAVANALLQVHQGVAPGQEVVPHLLHPPGSAATPCCYAAAAHVARQALLLLLVLHGCFYHADVSCAAAALLQLL